MPNDDVYEVLTAQKIRDFCDYVASQKHLVGDDYIRAIIKNTIVHPKTIADTERLYDEVFGKRWRTL